MRVVVVGAGIAGASAAFHLTQLGAEVCLVDNAAPGRATLAGAGIVCPWLSHNQDPRYEALAFAAVRYYPELAARLAALGETGVDYDLVGGLVVGLSPEQLNPVLKRLERHLEQGVKEIGEVRLLEKGKPKELFPYLAPGLAGLHLTGAARVSGESFRLGLLNAARKGGARELSGTAALRRSGGAVNGVRVAEEFIDADAVIVAAGAWSAQLLSALALPLAVEPQRGQIVHVKVSETNTEALPVIVPVLSDYYMLGFRNSRIVIGATRETGSGFDFRPTAGGIAEVLGKGLADRSWFEERHARGNPRRAPPNEQRRFAIAWFTGYHQRLSRCHWTRALWTDPGTLCGIACGPIGDWKNTFVRLPMLHARSAGLNIVHCQRIGAHSPVHRLSGEPLECRFQYARNFAG